MSAIFHITRASIFLILASFASTAFSVVVNSESGAGGASLDGAWVFPGCLLDPGEYDDMDYEEYLVFQGNTVEARIVQYESNDESCSGDGTIVESEVFDFTDQGDVQSLGWLAEDEDGNQVPVLPPPRQDGTGSLKDFPELFATRIAILIPGEGSETMLLYIDDTGGNDPEKPWLLWRNAGEDDDPSDYMSAEEPLSRVGPTTASVSIDIKPGSDPNSVNPRSKGVIPVAVLGSTDFDAMQVDFSTVTFGPDGASTAHDGHVEDVNEDGYMDMMFHFRTQESGIVCGDTQATLNGETFDGTPITGTDAVNTVGCKGASAISSDDAAATSGDGAEATTSAGATSWMLLIGLGVIGLWRLNRHNIRSI